ncbi:MAG: hypothetical protein GY715_09610 [Planctomycetes bacterium]|nr:hypothetical protein [Planctomycetota bacterium]
MRPTTMTALAAVTASLLWTSTTVAQTFGLDDNPSAPIGWGPPPVGPIPGFGAENPFGILTAGYPPGWAPSPVIVNFCRDSDLLGPSVIVQLFTPLGNYDDSLSSNTVMAATTRPIKLRFSVDRVTSGVPGSAVASQVALNQQPSDIFSTTDRFVSPLNPAYLAMTTAPGYGGPLPAPIAYAGPRNNLLRDDQTFGVWCGVPLPCPPPNVTAPVIGPGTHDNIDQYDAQLMDPTGAGTNAGWMYFTMYPDEAVSLGISAADVYDVAPGWLGTMVGFPFAPAAILGLGLAGGPDSIDALIMFDNNVRGGPGFGGPGAEPNVDCALFSLAPGSTSLAQYGLDASDVFYTNFTTTFWLYAPSANLGLVPSPGGQPAFQPDNVDALEILYHCREDLNGNLSVDFADILAVIGVWGPCHGCQHDLNDNGSADFADILAIIGAWGACPP